MAKLTNTPKYVPAIPARKSWQVYVDGSFFRSIEEPHVYIVLNSNKEAYYVIRLKFKITNYKVE